MAKLVESGKKRQTIRATRKRPIKVGDRVFLYTNLRTRACRKLGTGKVVSVQSIEIVPISSYEAWVEVNGRVLSGLEKHELAILDGFDSFKAFAAYFADGLVGQLIKWEPEPCP